MTSSITADAPPPVKRRKIDDDDFDLKIITEQLVSKSLDRPISPPHLKRKALVAAAPSWSFDAVSQDVVAPDTPTLNNLSIASAFPGHAERRAYQDNDLGLKFVPSPIQLTRIEGLGPSQNIDTIGLQDILGDALIKECWNFNFLFDLDFVMQQFHNDVRALVKIKIVHGFWKRDDERRIGLLETAEQYPNIELLSAYIPDPFGTHHSKMMVLFRHDDTAQVIIHTANMIPRDWSNMTQAVWSSPLLPLSPQTSSASTTNDTAHTIGSGQRFQADLLGYLAAYERRTNNLIRQLLDYDFSAVKAAFIGSTPSRQKPGASDPSSKTSFGWLGLEEILSEIPIASPLDPHSSASASSSSPHIVAQISSIATLGAQPTWLTHFQRILARDTHRINRKAVTVPSVSPDSSKETASPSPPTGESNHPKEKDTKFSVIFPTPAEIRTSLEGYGSGGSLHWKLQSGQQQKQLAYMHPLLCHWSAAPPVATATATDTATATTATTATAATAAATTTSASTPSLHTARPRNAHRGPAAPHIKTYIRFHNEAHTTIDWALLTSANLSKQAWGDVVNQKEQVWIQSWEAGVVLWPALFFPETESASESESESESECVAAGEQGREAPDSGVAVMVPVFGRDLPALGDVPVTRHGKREMAGREGRGKPATTVVGFRMPYNLPLHPYGAGEKPWCATMKYGELDWKGNAWGGY